MTLHVPEWTPADPGAPPPLAASDSSEGRVVALVATEGAVAGAWGAEVALELARGWSALGTRLVLADGGLENPTLHLTLTEIAGEGLTDALRWGVSVRRVARRPQGSRFYAVPAGTPVADGPALLQGPRWSALCAGFREAGVTLAVLVPAHDGCLSAVLQEADSVVVLAAPGESVPVQLLPEKAPILGVVGRAASLASEPPLRATPASEEAPTPELDSGMEGLPRPYLDAEGLSADFPLDTTVAEPQPEVALASPSEPEPGWAPEPDRQAGPEPQADPELFREGDLEDEADAAGPDPLLGFELDGKPVPTFEELVEESGSQRASVPWMGRRALAALALVILALASAVAVVLLGYVKIPWLSPGTAPSDALSEAGRTQAAVAALPAQETSDPALFSVDLASFQDEDSALALVRELSEKVPGVLFTNVPAAVAGRILHRVLAGPASDSAVATALGIRVAAAAGLGVGAWGIRRTPQAYQLGEMAELGAAQRRAEVLQSLGVPAYVLAVTYSDGSVRFRVYAGAYQDAAEAEYLSSLLQERGLSSAPLSDRTGRLPE